MSQIDGFTEQQVAALEKAHESLGEHFEGAIIVVSAEVHRPGFTADKARVYWSGGYYRALGMLEFANYRMLHDYPRENARVPGEEDE